MTLIQKHGDTAPGQKVRLVGRDGPAVLAAAEVVMHLAGHPDVSWPATVVDANEGIVETPRPVLPVEGRLSQRLRAEFEVTYAGGQIQTFPEDGYLTVTVWSDLDDR
jgi:hypothetical protein